MSDFKLRRWNYVGVVMTWGRLDDSFPEHPKVIGLSDGAFRLHVEGICYSARNLTDGVLPRVAVRRLTGGERRAGELVDAGVWDSTDGGWVIHDYLDYNPSADQVRSDREKARERKARSRSKANPPGHGDGHAVTPTGTDGVSHSSPSRPVPKTLEQSSVTEPHAAPQPDDDDGLGRDLVDAVVALKVAGQTPTNPGPYRAAVARSVPIEHGDDLRRILAEHPAWPTNWVAAQALGLDRTDPSPAQVIADCPDCINGLTETPTGMAVCPRCSWARNGNRTGEVT